ncbi:hypothetical protein O7626_39725 [Micromonospora sp. WMMD1102]|uniref:hypothetical protein n=1 Tax=Micromonospora sp. WMMD1102 TaxID=3016105 RepID=UPI0024152767|nr:hypothetical protein [Micromonospora sp. WMMD1102]MDG4791945.1 hypothetical protein [Micromonospora sp. WMMD1102]
MSDTDLTAQDIVCAAPRNGTRTTVCTLPPNHDDDHRSTDGQTWFNHGPVQTYEITWMSGHVETVPAHQVSFPHAGMLAAAAFSGHVPADGGAPRVQIHAEIDGQWWLMLSAREEDIRTMRNVTGGERLP